MSEHRRMKRLTSYANLCRRIKVLTERQNRLGEELAPLVPPFKVGDTIKLRGDHCGKEGIVLSMRLIPLNFHIFLEVLAQVLKPNGYTTNRKVTFEIPIFADGTIPTYEEQCPEPPVIRKITLKDM